MLILRTPPPARRTRLFRHCLAVKVHFGSLKVAAVFFAVSRHVEDLGRSSSPRPLRRPRAVRVTAEIGCAAPARVDPSTEARLRSCRRRLRSPPRAGMGRSRSRDARRASLDYALFAGCRGKITLNVVPPSREEVTVGWPPWALAISRDDEESKADAPCGVRRCVPRVIGSNRCACASAGIAGPDCGPRWRTSSPATFDRHGDRTVSVP